MKLTYTGIDLELSPKQREKFEAKVEKVSKVLGRNKDAEVHVILRRERFLHKVEIVMNAFEHTIVGVGSEADLFTAMCEAVAAMEKQILKLRTKWRDTHRNGNHKESGTADAEIAETE